MVEGLGFSAFSNLVSDALGEREIMLPRPRRELCYISAKHSTRYTTPSHILQSSKT